MRIVSLDVETHLIQPGLLAPPLVCLSWAERVETEGGSMVAFGLYDANDGALFFEQLLRDETAHIVMHNGCFDACVLMAHSPDLTPLVFQAYADGRMHDTQVRQELADIASGRRQDGGGTFVLKGGEWRRADYSLAGLVRQYLDKDRSAEKSDPDSWRMRYAELDGVAISQWPVAASKYALEDATDTLAVFEAQGSVAGAYPTETIQVNAKIALHMMSVWGLRTDPVMVPKLEADLLKMQAENRERLIACGFLAKEKCTASEVEEGKAEFFEPAEKTKLVTKKFMAENTRLEYRQREDGKWLMVTSFQQGYRWKKDGEAIKDAVVKAYETLGKPVPTTESGQVATDKDTLYQTGNETLKLLADGGGVDKILQTYIPVLKQGTEVPINARFNVLVNSGRTSCSQPNLQNLPSGRRVGGVRESFIARPGYVFNSTDYTTLELCALAEVCLELFEHSVMAEAINDDRDLHTEMAAALLGTTYEFAMDRIAAGDKEAKTARNTAKVANFGLPGGLGAQSLVDYARAGYGVTIDPVEAARLKDSWRSQWTEMNAYFQYINGQVGFGDATLVHPITGFIRGGVGYTDGCNHLFQHLAATGAKLALFQTAYECYVDHGTALFGSRPVAFIHDEILIELPEEIAHEAAERLNVVMCEQMARVIKRVRIKAEPTLMRRWTKEAKCVRDANGRLQVWEPKQE